MPVRAHVITGWTNLLQDALEEVKRKPITMRFQWNVPVDPPDQEGEPEPSEERPLVYYLFGHLDDGDSLVLSEDDYFDWSCLDPEGAKGIPKGVQTALTSNALSSFSVSDDRRLRPSRPVPRIKSFGGSAIPLETTRGSAAQPREARSSSPKPRRSTSNPTSARTKSTSTG